MLPKVKQIGQLGYFVIEFPDIYRTIGQRGIAPDPDIEGWCYSKKDLQSTTKIMVDTLAGKRMGRRGRVGGYFKRGLLRWHWFGDKNSGKWNPHANVLVDSGYIDSEKLEEIKTVLRQALNVPELIVHYSYCDTPGQMFQKVEYITRATFKNYNWNPYMANELFNFRNQRWWGKWNDEPVWTLNEVDKAEVDGLLQASQLQQGVCPDCGQPLRTLGHAKDGHTVKWTKPVDSTWLIIWGAEEIADTGYYRISDKAWNDDWQGGSLSTKEFLRLNELELQANIQKSVALLARERELEGLKEKARYCIKRYKREMELDSLFEYLTNHGLM